MRAVPPDRLQRRASPTQRMLYEPILPLDIADALWEQPDQLIAEATMLKPGDRCTVARIDHPHRPLVLKRYNLRGPVHTTTHGLMRSRAHWCWLAGRRLRAIGLNTPQPLAVLEQGRIPRRRRSFLLTEFITGPTLWNLVHHHAVDDARLERLAADFARIWHTLGEHRIGHGDMKASNFIVDEDDRIWLVDLDAMRRYLAPPVFHRRRRRDSERFMRNWETQPRAAAAFRAALHTAGSPVA